MQFIFHYDQILFIYLFERTYILEITEEIVSVTTQMESCFRLLIPHPSDSLFTEADFECEENTASDNLPNNDEDAAAGKKLRHHGFYDMKKSITIEIDKSNQLHSILAILISVRVHF